VGEGGGAVRAKRLERRRVVPIRTPAAASVACRDAHRRVRAERKRSIPIATTTERGPPSAISATTERGPPSGSLALHTGPGGTRSVAFARAQTVDPTHGHDGAWPSIRCSLLTARSLLYRSRRRDGAGVRLPKTCGLSRAERDAQRATTPYGQHRGTPAASHGTSAARRAARHSTARLG
jgi:hypothetical protein